MAAECLMSQVCQGRSDGREWPLSCKLSGIRDWLLLAASDARETTSEERSKLRDSWEVRRRGSLCAESTLYVFVRH